MNPIERIAKLEKQLEKVQNENARLKADQTRIHEFTRKFPEDVWYVEFLRDQVRALELVNDKLQSDFDALFEHAQRQSEVLKSFDVITPQQEF